VRSKGNCSPIACDQGHGRARGIEQQRLRTPEFGARDAGHRTDARLILRRQERRIAAERRTHLEVGRQHFVEPVIEGHAK